MSVLKLKLDKAAEQFQTHNFKESLVLYQDCLAFCYRTREAQTLIFNIMTAKGALLCILGELQRAMTTLNEVLRADPNHYLALIRRSQVYKKKGKFNRALKDLEMLSTFCPDNLQVAAMRIEIENMKSRVKAGNSSEEESESEEMDEEVVLNFSNLKKIDRKSCSIMMDPAKMRKSRVTISGDTAFEYEREDDGDKSFNSTQVSKQQLKEKYLRTSKEIEADKDTPLAPATTIVAKPTNRSKSILKNRASTLVVEKSSPAVDKNSYGGRDSKLVEKIKNIDGKVIGSNHSLDIGSSKSVKEVQFCKSGFASQYKKDSTPVIVAVPEKKVKQSRKSCLKRCSFEQAEQEVKKQPVRKSKFQMMSRNSIDGVVIKNRKSIDAIKEIKDIQNDKLKKDDKGEESDEGSSYNIFGSSDNVVISKEIKDKLGFGREQPKEGKTTPKQRANGGKSILKKNSVLSFDAVERPGKSTDVRESSEEKTAKKPKKSVMFGKSRFAE